MQHELKTQAWQVCGIQALRPVNGIGDSFNAQKVKQKLTFEKHYENLEKDKRKDTLSVKNFCYNQECTFAFFNSISSTHDGNKSRITAQSSESFVFSDFW